MELAEIIRVAVRAVGGYQVDLAAKVGTAQSVVSRWVSGQATPDFESCLALAEITGLPPHVILSAAGHDPRRLDVVASQPTPGFEPDALLVAMAWPRLEEGIRHAIKILARITAAYAAS